MSESEAIIAYGTVVRVRATPVTPWFKLGELTTVTPPRGTADDVDVTHMESPDRTREFIQGLINRGEVPAGINWIPGNPTDEYLSAWEIAGDRRETQIEYPNGVTDTFKAYIKEYGGAALTPEGKMGADLTLKVAGAKARGVAE